MSTPKYGLLGQWCKKLSKVPGLSFSTPDARFVYIRLISDAHIKIFIKPNKSKVEEHRGSKIPNTAYVIYAWDKKILTFSKNSKFCNRKFIKMTTY